jgi:hypothetical protein
MNNVYSGESSMNRHSDDRAKGATTPICSRRSFVRVAAASGGAGLLSACLLPIGVQARVNSASQVALPPATPDVRPFEVHVPEAALQDLKRRLGDTRWLDKETVTDWSQGVPLAKATQVRRGCSTPRPGSSRHFPRFSPARSALSRAPKCTSEWPTGCDLWRKRHPSNPFAAYSILR